MPRLLNLINTLRLVSEGAGRPALPVGTVSTYHDGTKWKKTRTGWKKLTTQDPSPVRYATSEPTAEPAWYKSGLDKFVSDFENKGLSRDEAKYAANAVSRWRGSSIQEASSHLRGAVAALVGRSLDQETEALSGAMSATGLFSDVPNKESTAEWRSSMGALRRGFQGGTPLDTVATNAVAKLAALSQKEYSEKTITLYRGVNAGQLRALKDSGVLKVGALSSWTEDRKIAATFGNTIKAEVPREQVAMSWRACPGLSAEQEVVLACKGGIRVSTLRTESIGLSYVSVNVANIVILLVSDESEIGSVDGYDDWLHKK